MEKKILKSLFLPALLGAAILGGLGLALHILGVLSADNVAKAALFGAILGALGRLLYLSKKAGED